MKKIILLCTGILLGALTGCSSESNPEPEQNMEALILEAYEAGKQDAINAIKEEANNDFTHYASVEVLEEVIVNFFGNDEYAYEMRDCILWHPDVEFYESDALVDKYIKDSQIEESTYETYSYPDNLKPN